MRLPRASPARVRSPIRCRPTSPLTAGWSLRSAWTCAAPTEVPLPTAVRMIWTRDHLDAARRLQGTLIGPAQTVSMQQSVTILQAAFPPGLSRHPTRAVPSLNRAHQRPDTRIEVRSDE